MALPAEPLVHEAHDVRDHAQLAHVGDGAELGQRRVDRGHAHLKHPVLVERVAELQRAREQAAARSPCGAACATSRRKCARTASPLLRARVGARVVEVHLRVVVAVHLRGREHRPASRWSPAPGPTRRRRAPRSRSLTLWSATGGLRADRSRRTPRRGRRGPAQALTRDLDSHVHVLQLDLGALDHARHPLGGGAREAGRRGVGRPGVLGAGAGRASGARRARSLGGSRSRRCTD